MSSVGNHNLGSLGVTVHNCSLSPQPDVGELMDDVSKPLHALTGKWDFERHGDFSPACHFFGT